MLSTNQIKELSKKFKINESVILREFIQITFLKELYQRPFSKNIYFKGGTAIRLLYGGERFSEDLDFSVMQDKQQFEQNVQKLFTSISNQYPFIFKERKTLTGKTYLLTTTIPDAKSDIFIKLDFSIRENVLDPVQNILQTEYPVIMQDFIYSLSKDEIFAEKIRAIIKRKKHRDIYDLWILLELGAQMNIRLIEEKLKYYDEKFDSKELQERLTIFSKEDFIKDLRPFIPTNQREKLGNLFDYIITYLQEKLFNQKK